MRTGCRFTGVWGPIVGIELKRITGRSAILSQLFLSGPLSRSELTERLGLSSGAVSKITAELIDEQVIAEAGQVESGGGRPRVLLRMDPNYGRVIGVVIGETDIRVEIFDWAMTQLAEFVSPLPAVSFRGGLDADMVADLIVDGVRGVIVAADVADETVIGVGVSVPGTVEQGSAAFVHAPIVGWVGVPLGWMLRERGLMMPVHVERGAKAVGQAEMWFGAGRGVGRAIMVLVGSEVGAAVVTDDVTHPETGSIAGGWGHTTIVFGGRKCRCGRNGCLEAYVGAQSVLERYRNMGMDDEIVGGNEFSQLASLLETSAQPSMAADLMDEVADLLGAGIANLTNLFHPERVMLGGWMGLALGRHRLPRIREVARENSLPHLAGTMRIELSALDTGALMLGAATLPVVALLLGDRYE